MYLKSVFLPNMWYQRGWSFQAEVTIRIFWLKAMISTPKWSHVVKFNEKDIRSSHAMPSERWFCLGPLSQQLLWNSPFVWCKKNKRLWHLINTRWGIKCCRELSALVLLCLRIYSVGFTGSAQPLTNFPLVLYFQKNSIEQKAKCFSLKIKLYRERWESFNFLINKALYNVNSPCYGAVSRNENNSGPQTSWMFWWPFVRELFCH